MVLIQIEKFVVVFSQYFVSNMTQGLQKNSCSLYHFKEGPFKLLTLMSSDE